jgi:hypothetical protein
MNKGIIRRIQASGRAILNLNHNSNLKQAHFPSYKGPSIRTQGSSCLTQHLRLDSGGNGPPRIPRYKPTRINPSTLPRRRADSAHRQHRRGEPGDGTPPHRGQGKGGREGSRPSRGTGLRPAMGGAVPP